MGSIGNINIIYKKTAAVMRGAHTSQLAKIDQKTEWFAIMQANIACVRKKARLNNSGIRLLEDMDEIDDTRILRVRGRDIGQLGRRASINLRQGVFEHYTLIYIGQIKFEQTIDDCLSKR